MGRANRGAGEGGETSHEPRGSLPEKSCGGPPRARVWGDASLGENAGRTPHYPGPFPPALGRGLHLVTEPVGEKSLRATELLGGNFQRKAAFFQPLSDFPAIWSIPP